MGPDGNGVQNSTCSTKIVTRRFSPNLSPGGLGLVSGHPHVLYLPTGLEECEYLLCRHIAGQVTHVDGTSYLLNLCGVHVTSERRRLGDHCTHQRDERRGRLGVCVCVEIFMRLLLCRLRLN